MKPTIKSLTQENENLKKILEEISKHISNGYYEEAEELLEQEGLSTEQEYCVLLFISSQEFMLNGIKSDLESGNDIEIKLFYKGKEVDKLDFDVESVDK